MKLDNFINRPVLSTVISIVIVILGFIGLATLPIEQYPDIAPPTIMVICYYPGADAKTVENSVLAPLEEQINGVEGMTYMTSSATNDGSASITVYFEQGANPDMAQVNVQNRVSQATALLPSEVTQSGVTVQKRQTSTVLIMSLYSPDDRYDEKFLGNYADINIIPEMKRIKGIGDCESIGLKSYTMRLWLDPTKMHDLGLIPTDIVGALAEQNIEAAPGKFGEQSDKQYEYSMKYTGRLKTPEEFGNMIIKTDDMGRILRVKDVAKVEMGALYYSVLTQLDGHPALMMMVTQRAGSNATAIANDVKATAERLSKNFPPGMKIKVMQDVTEFIEASQHEVYKTLFEALLLVFMVVFVFLQDFRSTLIPMIAVPVSLIGTMFFLKVIGFSINLLTLSALVLAIAIVVDDAIVVVEAVHAKLDMGYHSAKKASIDAMSEIAGAIISITLVMSAVFVPVSFMSGTTGTFYREFGLTMAISIIISAVNALTLSPALCAILLKPHGGDGGEKKQSFTTRFFAGFNAAYDKLQNKYQKAVSILVKKSWIAIVAVVIGVVALLSEAVFTKTGLVPDEDTGTVFVTVSTPPGTSLLKTDKLMDEVQRMLDNNPAIDGCIRIAGYNFIAGQGSNQGTFVVKLKPFDERSRSEYSSMVLGMIYKQTAAIKGAQILAFQPPMVTGFSANNGLSFSMQDRTGGDLDKFFKVTQDFIAELNKRPEFANCMTSFNSSYPQYQINVDVAKCKQAGISPSAVLTTMQGYYGGMYSSNFNSFGKLYRVYVQGDPKTREDKASLQNIYVRTPKGMAPVSEFANLKKVYGPQVIDRFNLFTAINVNGTPADGYSTGDCIAAMEEVAESSLPAGYTYEFSGLTRNEAESSNTTGIVLVLCVVFVYLILSAQYESYLLPLSVILSLPFGLAGAFLFTNLFGKNNDIYMQIALIMLVGLLAKNAILIVQFALERRQLGMAISWSAILGAAARLRPILMTALAMIIGLFPLIVTGLPGLSLFMAPAVGENGYVTLGAAAIGGMLVGTFLQVLIVPVLFVIFQWLQEKIKPMEFNDENAAIDSELHQYAISANAINETISGSDPHYVK